MGAAILQNNQLVALGVAGRRRIDQDAPVQASDAFHLGSDTKAITASVVARLVERGKISWDETMDRALPNLAGDLHPSYRKVTIELLLRHLGGLPGGGAFTEEFTKGFDEQWPIERQRAWMTQRFLRDPPEYEPGTRFEYSSYDYLIIGHVLEQRTGKSWERLVQEEVFAPLSMNECGFGPTATATAPNGVWAHKVDGTGYVPTEEDNPQLIGPAGTVHCSLASWARFAAAHLGSSKHWLSPATLEYLHRPVTAPALPQGKSIALGWGVTTGGEERLLTHDGSNGYNYALIRLAPDWNGAVFVTCNAGDERAAAAAKEVSSVLLARLKDFH
jgi:CubicO group peptidase (beta-lactamase class C family)